MDLETGQTLMHRKLPSDKYFGEGIVILGQRLFQVCVCLCLSVSGMCVSVSVWGYASLSITGVCV